MRSKSMVHIVKPPCDDGVIQSAPQTGKLVQQAQRSSGAWVLVATILGSSMAFIDGTVVNVALPVLQADLNASAAQVQWVVEAYALFLSALILVGGALLVPGSLAIISASFDSKQRGQAIGTWSGFTSITSAIGPVLGGWLVQY